METRIEHGNAADVDRFLEDLKTVVRDGQALLKAGASTVKEKAIAGARSTDRIVREKPYQTMGVAFGLGLLIGVLATSIIAHRSDRDSEG